MDKRKIVISFLLIIIVIIFYYFNLFNFLELKTYDILLLVKHFISPVRVNEVVIVKIDESFLQGADNWPLKRGLYAEAVKILNNEGARAVGIDIILTGESTQSKEDEKLAEVLTKYNNVVLPIEAKLKMFRGLNYDEIAVEDIIKPLKVFDKNAITGHINFIPDRDGIIRRLPVSFDKNQEEYHSFSYELAVTAGYKIPELKEKEVMLNFIGPTGTIPGISMGDLFEGHYLPGFFQGKIVLIGVDISSLGDKYMTPFSRYSYLSGVELHGQAIYNLIHGIYIKQSAPIINILLLITIMGVFTFIFLRYPPFISRKVGFYFLLFMTGINLVLFYNCQLFLPLATIWVAVGLLYGVSLLQWYLSSEKEKVRILELFGRYISEELINELIKAKEPLRLGGDRVELSVMFLDIRGFTSYTEEQLPEKVVSELNQTFEIILEIIFKYKGTLDKYLGDGLMAFFGAPVFLADHRDRCIKAALEIRKLELPFQFGIGINSGQVIIGNIGSLKRMDYTVIGDVVNKAFRFVELSGPGEIIIGENTFSGLLEIQPEGDWKSDKVNLKGSRQETVIYRLSEEVVYR